MKTALSTHSRYSSVAIALHWSIAILIVANLVIGLVHESVGREVVVTVMDVHKGIGLLVLALSVLRLLWRLGHAVPQLPGGTPVWQVALSRTTHLFFYVAMIALPLTGWLIVSAAPVRFPLSFFWLFDVPYLPVAQGKPLAHFWSEIHEILAFATIGVLVLHVAAALKHHLIDKDDVMTRMLPMSKGQG